MLCDVCKRSLEGTNDPTVTPRLQAVAQEDRRSCDTLFDIEEYVFGHHRTRESLVRSIEQGCRICVELEDPREYEHDFTCAPNDYFTGFSLKIYDEVIYVFLRRGTATVFNGLSLIPLEAAQEEEDWNLELDGTTGGQHARELIDEWDKDCLAKHLRCGQVSDSHFLPTRMLQFQDISNPSTCSLVLREEVPPDSRYTALSYCWGASGEQEKMCLSQSTFDSLRTGLPLESLPNTYVDAIHVTAQLGIRYIWIDALCIIQDSQHDWRSEASTMQAVYRNSYLTISAVAGAHANSGLFYSRDPAKVQPTVVTFAYTSCDKAKPFVYPHDKDEGWIASWQIGNVTTNRGWCLQERLLPSRVLHFGAQQVFWECRERHASETNPRAMSYACRRLWKNLIDQHDRNSRPGDSYKRLFSEWYNTLSMYSSCQLTHASDKLVAISGLANDMKSALDTCRPGTHHTYLAGLWSEDLRFGLCWRLTHFGRRPATYRAPSWSPMSLCGFTYWHWPLEEKECEEMWYVGDADCTAVTHCVEGLDTGEVTGGQLQLRGPWTTIQLVKPSPLDDTRNERRLAYFQYSDSKSALESSMVETFAWISYDTKDDMVEQAFCMLIYAKQTNTHWPFRGIVLAAVEDERFIYRRIGMIMGYFDAADATEKAHIFLSQCEKRSVTVI